MVVFMDTAKIVDTMKSCMPGFRNDGITPSWHHPMDVLAIFNKMIKNTNVSTTDYYDINDIDAMKAVCILHDILEDGKIDERNFSEHDLAKLIGYSNGHHPIPRIPDMIYSAVIALTKTGNTSFGTMGLIEYFTEQIAHNDIAIIVKCCDRIANLTTAEKDFKPYRLARYKWETKMLVIPMLDNTTGFDKWDAWLRHELTELSYTENQPRK